MNLFVFRIDWQALSALNPVYRQVASNLDPTPGSSPPPVRPAGGRPRGMPVRCPVPPADPVYTEPDPGTSGPTPPPMVPPHRVSPRGTARIRPGLQVRYLRPRDSFSAAHLRRQRDVGQPGEDESGPTSV